jgi:hypothetical protein
LNNEPIGVFAEIVPEKDDPQVSSATEIKLCHRKLMENFFFVQVLESTTYQLNQVDLLLDN